MQTIEINWFQEVLPPNKTIKKKQVWSFQTELWVGFRYLHPKSKSPPTEWLQSGGKYFFVWNFLSYLHACGHLCPNVLEPRLCQGSGGVPSFATTGHGHPQETKLPPTMLTVVRNTAVSTQWFENKQPNQKPVYNCFVRNRTDNEFPSCE